MAASLQSYSRPAAGENRVQKGSENNTAIPLPQSRWLSAVTQLCLTDSFHSVTPLTETNTLILLQFSKWISRGSCRFSGSLQLFLMHPWGNSSIVKEDSTLLSTLFFRRFQRSFAGFIWHSECLRGSFRWWYKDIILVVGTLNGF